MPQPKQGKKADIKAVALTSGIRLGAGIVGGAVGAVVGRPSVALGIVTIALGTFIETKGNNLGQAVAFAGAGMMLGYHAVPQEAPVPVSGLQGVVEDGQNRGVTFLKNIGRNLYLDKTPLKETLGLGSLEGEEVTYHTSMNDSPVMSSDQLQHALMAQMGNNVPVSGIGMGSIEEDFGVSGIEEDFGVSGIEEDFGYDNY